MSPANREEINQFWSLHEAMNHLERVIELLEKAAQGRMARNAKQLRSDIQRLIEREYEEVQDESDVS